ncbi:MAG TPA: alpha/beta hydrolase, partial [Solirubrobacteraceae bacterium]|nr:alpha/beta hydrolase [Solirubrobacteraceae bacterium]
MLDHTVSTPDGRTLLVQEGGDPRGAPILFHGGTPNSRLLAPSAAARAAARGVRLISYDRPGYGGSSRQEGRTVADCAADVRVIAEALGIDSLRVYGLSGGGPHALACAARLEDLVPAVATVGSVAPWEAEGLDYFAGMGEINVEDTELYLRDPAGSREKLEAERVELLAADAGEMLEAWATLLSPADAAVLTGEYAEHLVAGLRDGLGAGGDGWWDDGVAHMEPWGFDCADIRTPTLIVHGEQDRFVPFQHGEWLAVHIPGAEAWLSEDDGHLTPLERRLEDVLDWLLARM